MFILKKEDVTISTIAHPKQERLIPILSYGGQTFRILRVFPANQAQEAMEFWQDLTKRQGNDNFANRVSELLEELSASESTHFLEWLDQSPVTHLWR